MSVSFHHGTTPLETSSTFYWFNIYTIFLQSSHYCFIYFSWLCPCFLIFPQSWDSTLYLKKKLWQKERNVWQCFNWRLRQPFTFWQVLILFSSFANTLPQVEDPRWTIWLFQINGIVIKDIPAYHKIMQQCLLNRKGVLKCCDHLIYKTASNLFSSSGNNCQ